MSKRITIREVAIEAKVSIGTVDRVLHNRGKVSKEKIKAVEEAVKNLSYKPSKVAQTLALQKRTIKIGVTYPDVEKYFWNEVKSGILELENELEHFGVEFIVKTTESYNVEEQIAALNYLKEQKVNGIVLMPSHTSKLNSIIDKLESEKIPVVTFVSDSPKSKRLFSVGVNDFNGGYIAGKLMELYMMGKGNVAIIGIHRDVLCIQQRVSGFVEKIETECPNINIAKIKDVREGSYSYDNKFYQNEVYRITCDILKKTPDLGGIYITNSLTSCAGKAVRDLGKQERIKIIGHERSEVISQLLKENVINATVCQNPKDEVCLTIKYLYDYLVDKKLPKDEVINTKLEILIRENNYLNAYNLKY